MSIEKLFFSFNRTFCLFLDNKDSSLHAIESCADVFDKLVFTNTHTHPTIMMPNLY